MSQEKKFETIIHYSFVNEGLLRQALTHSSYANEKHMKKLSDNERLEFLGDAVLEIITSEFLYQQYQNLSEGELTKMRASIVCEQTLALCANQIKLGDFLYLGKGEENTGGRQRKSLLSDAFEAVIGAIYLDKGLEFAKAFIHSYVLTDVEKKQLFHDSKTLLQEIVQAKENCTLEYILSNVEGPDHARIYTIEARINESVMGVGKGSTKKTAEQEAAYETILKLKQEGSNTCI